ncbi:MAG TPA: hypothetical protein VFS08_17730 [Gemmatimonadaceae bacterium]|nr:hypothetical protein [Gemmatimonadaceae bacterium]
MREFKASDGVRWGVEVRLPGASNAMVVFHHPGGRTSRLDRYAWYVWPGTEALDVTARVSPRAILERLTDADLARLFRRSMPIGGNVPSSTAPVHGGGTI